MAANSDALQNLSDERKSAQASVEAPEGGIWPVGGNPVPDATTAVENADPATVPSGRIKSTDKDQGDDESPAADDGDTPDVGKPATSSGSSKTDESKADEPPTGRRRTSSKTGQAKT